MKKLVLPLTAMAFFVCSCSSSGIESDVRKMARLQCETQDLMTKAANGDEKAEKELDGKRKQAEDFAKKMEEKYKDKKDDKDMEAKAQKVYEEEMKKCADKLKK
jgi:hypothetical protein